MRKKLFVVCAVIIFAAQIAFAQKWMTQGPVEPSPYGEERAPRQAFQAMLYKTVAEMYSKYLQSGSFPTNSVSLRPIFNQQVTAIFGTVRTKEGEQRTAPVYGIANSGITLTNAEGELKKAVEAVIKFCDAAVDAQAKNLLMTKEQSEFVASPEEQEVVGKFVETAKQRLDQFLEKWLTLEPRYISPSSKLTVLDGKKYFIIYVSLKNDWGIGDVFLVVKYPFEEIRADNIDQKVSETLDKITEFLMKKLYIDKSGKTPEPSPPPEKSPVPITN